MKYVLAVDGGGTKTHVLCADETGQVIGEGYAGPTNMTAITPGAASFNLREGVRQATEKLEPGFVIQNMVMGLAGADSVEEEQNARQVFLQVLQDYTIENLTLVNDTVIALANGSEATDALILVAGTGSNCFGHNSEGKTAKAGGMDYILADQGSGYSIGRAVLRKAVKSFDGRGPHTELEQFVCEHFKISSIAELKPKVHNPLLTKTEIAELAQVCLRAFDQGDATAKDIFDHNLDELYTMATAVINRLGLKDKKVDLVLAGSITKIAYIQNNLTKRLQEYCPALNVIVPTTAPVHGALKMALKK
ncbi:MAG TPA: BadF/BadG/BcrA/BcrD ATPase family protein [Vitreimonas sp.]|nr:BadF/BadG/BcrA/BcrD ATPase family protein [Vitreimonas sp.]